MDSEIHLTYDIHSVRRHAISYMKATNPNLSTRAIRCFVNDVVTERTPMNAFHNVIHTLFDTVV